MSEWGPGRITRTVRAGLESDSTFGAVVPPIYLSSNFAFSGFGEPRAHDYTRSGNPTRDVLTTALAELEGGAGGVVTSTGMGAITCLGSRRGIRIGFGCLKSCCNRHRSARCWVITRDF